MSSQAISLTPQLERFVQEAVDSGEFDSASEVHRAAIAAMARERQERALRLQRLRQEIQLGMDSGSSVEMASIESFLEDCWNEATPKE